MPFCPTCRAEYVASVARCPTCDAALVAELGADAMDAKRERMVQAVSAGEVVGVGLGSLSSCEELAGELEAAMVPAKVVKPSHDCESESGHPCAHFAVVVLKEDAEQAQRAMKGRFDALLAAEGIAAPGAGAEGDACPACGTKVPEDAGECPDCGLAFG